MKKLSNSLTKNDKLKLTFLISSILMSFGVFFISPTLSTPMLISVLFTMLVSPWVSALERRNLSRNYSIFIIFSVFGLALFTGGFWVTKTSIRQWDTFKEKAPRYFTTSVDRMKEFETELKAKYEVLNEFNPTDQFLEWGEQTGQWFLVNGPKLIGDILTWLLLVPFITYVLLKEGRNIRKIVFDLVPNRFFETTVMISTQITKSLSDYIRAKLIEAFLLGLMTYVGLVLIDAPYALVLAVFAGVTNILPYLGPIMGAVPGILITLSDPTYSQLLLPIVLVYSITNIVDMTLIFPIFVAKLVNLHPLILIAAVVIGQKYYGLVGMLLSIPIAAAIKVFIQETYQVIYQPLKNAHRSKPT